MRITLKKLRSTLLLLFLGARSLRGSENLTEQLRSVSPAGETAASLLYKKSARFKNNFFIAAQQAGSFSPYLLALLTTDRQRSFLLPLLTHQHFTSNPVTSIDQLALLFNRFPVFSVKTGTNAGESKNKIFLLSPDGSSVISNSDQLMAPDNTELLDLSLAALAASNQYIFALAGNSFGNFGLTLLTKDVTGSALRTRSFNGTIGQSPAYGIQKAPPANALNNVNISTDIISFDVSQASLYWDDQLERLFIGLIDVKATNLPATTDTTTVLCAVGRFDTSGTFIMEPIIALNQNLITDNQKNYLGFKQTKDSASSPVGSLFKLGIMHTSTGRAYLIAQGGVCTDETEKAQLGSLIFALPLVPRHEQARQDSVQTQDEYEKSIGLCAGKNQYAQKASSSNPLATADDYGTHVGVSADYLDRNEEKSAIITDLQIIGDTVYVSLAGERSATNPQEQGIFSSTALFNETGDIVAWTAWERCMGAIEKVNLFSIDQNSQRCTYVAPTQPAGSALKTTIWSQGDTKLEAQGGLHDGSPLSQAFTFEHFGPMYHLSNFDDETPGFYGTAFGQGFSLMVATGNNKVALIQTADVFFETSALTPQFFPTRAFVTPAMAAQEQESQLIANVFIKECSCCGLIKAAELSKITPDSNPSKPDDFQKGWLFVGGTQGVAVLSRANGEGWNAQDGLAFLSSDSSAESSYGFPGGSSWHFYPLLQLSGEAFKDCRSLASDGTFLYILTGTALWRILMTPEGFGDKKKLVPANQLLKIADLTQAPFSGSATTDAFIALLLTNRTADKRELLLATTKGLFRNSIQLRDQYLTQDISSQITWEKILDAQCVTLSFTGEKRGEKFGSYFPTKNNDCAYGNLLVTAVTNDTQEVGVYRFAIATDDSDNTKSSCKPFKECYFKEAPVNEQARTKQWLTLGKALAPARELFNPTRHAFVLQQPYSVPLFPSENYFLWAGFPNSAINLNLSLANNKNYQPITRDTSSGALYGYGQTGLYVNE